jgi:inhibitor of KinA sporulation pathway (predicted exonuclease)
LRKKLLNSFIQRLQNHAKHEFSKDIQKIEINESDVDIFVEQFEDKLKKLLDKHAPIKQKTVISRAPKPWFSEEILDLKQRFRKAERMWRKYKTPELYELFKSARNKYSFAIFNEKRQKISDKIVSYKGNSKKLYNFVAD